MINEFSRYAHPLKKIMVKFTNKLRKQRYRLTADLRFLLRSLLTIFLIQQLLRLAYMIATPTETIYLPFPIIAEAMYFGARFDLMVSTWVCIPMIIAMAFPSGLRARSLWRAWLSFMGLFTIIAGIISISFYQLEGDAQGQSFYVWLAQGENIPWELLISRWESAIWLMVIVLFAGLLHELVRASDLTCRNVGKETRAKRLGYFAVIVLVATLSLRGTLHWGPPLKPEEANFSSYVHANHIAANATFTVIRTRMRMAEADH
jgi:hypothetical protein